MKIKFVKGTKFEILRQWDVVLVDEQGNEKIVATCFKSSKGGWRGNLYGQLSIGWETDRWGRTRGEVAESLVEKYLEIMEEKKVEEVKAEAPEVENEIAVDVVAPEKEVTEYQHKTFTATFITLVSRGINRVLLKDDRGEPLVLSVEEFENQYEPKVERLAVKEIRRISKAVSEIEGVQKVKQIYKGCYCVKIKNTKILSFKASDKEEGKLRIDPHWNVRFFKDTESLHLTESELKDLILDKLKM